MDPELGYIEDVRSLCDPLFGPSKPSQGTRQSEPMGDLVAGLLIL